MSAEVLQPTLSYLEQRILLRSAQERWRDLCVSAALLLVAAAAHVVSINGGLFMEDYWHRAVIRSRGWDLQAQQLSSSFELPGAINHLWWQDKPLRHPTVRPVAMLIMKIEYTLTGGRVWALHILSLLWHGLACMLVFHLGRWLMLGRGWCFLGGAMFAVSPHSVVAVGWLSARSELVGAVFFLAAVLAYANASAVEFVRRSRRSHRMYQVGWETVHTGWLLVAFALWILSVLSWEPALVLPVILLLLDFGYGGRGLLLQRIPVHAAMFSAALAFAYWRFCVFAAEDGSLLPATWPEGWHVLPWVAGRLLQLLVGLLLGQPLLSEVLHLEILDQDRLLPLLLIVLMLIPVMGWYEYASRAIRCRFLWPLWMVVILAVCAPSFVLPQAGYLPFAGCAVMGVIMMSHLRGRILKALGFVLALGLLLPLTINTLLWRGVVRSEQLLYADVQANAPRPMPGSQAFFINLPLAGLYAPVAMQELWSLNNLESPPDLAGHVLTFSPNPLMMGVDCLLEQTAENELVVSTAEQGYFGGITGQILSTYTRSPAPLSAGTVVHGEVFDTTVMEANETGVHKLKFTFVQSLNSKHYQFYVSSAKRPLYHWRPTPQPQPLNETDKKLFDEARSSDVGLSLRAKQKIMQRAVPLVIQLASPIQRLLVADPNLQSSSSLEQLEVWWRSVGASELIQQRLQWLNQHRSMLRDRERTMETIRWLGTLLPFEVLSSEQPTIATDAGDEPAG